MNINKNVKSATFIKRPNRFQAYVELEGQELMVHVPNTGRCKEILTPGTEVLLREENNPSRKTKYDLIAGYKGDLLINIDSQVPNKVVEEALSLGKVSALAKYNVIHREKFYKSSRFDFKLGQEPYLHSDYPQEYFLEVKGVTYEVDGITMFPDAPTERGARHLRELVEVKKEGLGAGVLFLIQLQGVHSFSPYKEMDPNFAAALSYAKENGVDIFAYDSIVHRDSITLNKEVPVIL